MRHVVSFYEFLSPWRKLVGTPSLFPKHFRHTSAREPVLIARFSFIRFRVRDATSSRQPYSEPGFVSFRFVSFCLVSLVFYGMPCSAGQQCVQVTFCNAWLAH